jgi:nucleotide-binding universal stress UspA family protein
MSWGPIVVGVDGSTEAANAAALAQRLARDFCAACQLVHAVRDEWAPLAAVGDAERVREMQRLQLAVARDRVAETLRGRVSPELFAALDVRFGPAALVLQQVAEEQNAGLLVLGGKQHGALARWLGGSTSLNVVRGATIPVLVTGAHPAGIRRVLVAADLSSAAQPTLALAQRFARRVGAQLRVLSVFEPLPVVAGVPPVDPAGYYDLSQELLRREIWPLVREPGVEKVVRHGMVVETLLREVTDWRADVLVVGSHGKGWAQRILLGSVTEGLLNHLPTSVLVAPVAQPVAREDQQPAEVAAVQ